MQSQKDQKYYDRVSAIMHTSKQEIAEELVNVMELFYKQRIDANNEKIKLLRQCEELQKENARLKAQLGKMFF